MCFTGVQNALSDSRFQMNDSAENAFVTKPQIEERTQVSQEASGVKAPEKDIFSSPVGMVLQYLAAIGEIFIFPENKGLNDKCIIKPLAFIRELR